METTSLEVDGGRFELDSVVGVGLEENFSYESVILLQTAAVV